MSWNPLFSDLLDSSLWIQNRDRPWVKLVWVTILAAKDHRGEIETGLVGLAHRAGVTLEQAGEAIVALSSPDPTSRTDGHEGRRIEKTEFGWRVLNHEVYRERVKEASRRAYKAKWARERRHKGDAKFSRAQERAYAKAVVTEGEDSAAACRLEPFGAIEPAWESAAPVRQAPPEPVQEPPSSQAERPEVSAEATPPPLLSHGEPQSDPHPYGGTPAPEESHSQTREAPVEAFLPPQPTSPPHREALVSEPVEASSPAQVLPESDSNCGTPPPADPGAGELGSNPPGDSSAGVAQSPSS